MLIEMRVHARYMSLELRDEFRSIRLGRGANASIDLLDRSSYLRVAVEQVHVTAHVGLGRAAHHSGPHHPVARDGLQEVSKQIATGKPQPEQGTAGGQQTDRSAPRDPRHRSPTTSLLNA